MSVLLFFNWPILSDTWFFILQSFCFLVEEFWVILMILLTHGICSVACASVSIAFSLVQFWPPSYISSPSGYAGGRLNFQNLSQHSLKQNDLTSCGSGQVGLGWPVVSLLLARSEPGPRVARYTSTASLPLTPSFSLSWAPSRKCHLSNLHLFTLPRGPSSFLLSLSVV